MDERLKFIGRLLEGAKMAPLCREFGISRVTGYKIYNRYKECGLDGLYDRSRAPYRQANKLPYQVERTILGIKKKHPTWGASKTRDKLIRQCPMIPAPAVRAKCGRICLGSRKINCSVVFAGQLLGIREVEDAVWQVSFLEYDLGYFDKDQDRVEPGPNPFAPDKVLTMCPE
jgi:hypothetical protein